MKRNILALFLFGLISSGAYAQDDMYFTPKKTEKVVKEVTPVASYHENHMDVDEYNRRGFGVMRDTSRPQTQQPVMLLTSAHLIRCRQLHMQGRKVSMMKVIIPRTTMCIAAV